MENNPPSLPASPVPPASFASLVDPGEKGVRALGWLLVLLGVGLSVGTALIAYQISHTIALTNQPGSHARWNGGPEFTRTTFRLFGATFFFGLFSLAAGFYQVRTGRRSLWLVGLMFAALAAITLFGFAIIRSMPVH